MFKDKESATECSLLLQTMRTVPRCFRLLAAENQAKPLAFSSSGVQGLHILRENGTILLFVLGLVA